MAGIIACTVKNWSFSPPKEAAKPSDFMPSRATTPEKKVARGVRANRIKVANDIRAWVQTMRKRGMVVDATESTK